MKHHVHTLAKHTIEKVNTLQSDDVGVGNRLVPNEVNKYGFPAFSSCGRSIIKRQLDDSSRTPLLIHRSTFLIATELLGYSRKKRVSKAV